MAPKANHTDTARFRPRTKVSLQKTLRALGGREISTDESLREGEHYGLSIEGRRFVFRDPTAFNRFKEELRV